MSRYATPAMSAPECRFPARGHTPSSRKARRLWPWGSGHRVTVRGGITTGHEHLELSLDVREQAAGAEAEEVRLEPFAAEFFLHQQEIIGCLTSGADAAGGLVADLEPRPLGVFADLADHGQGDRQRRVHAFLAGGRLDEVRAGHHRHDRSTGDVRERRQFTCCEDGLEVSGAARRPKCFYFVIERVPVAGEDVGARDHDVYFPRSGGNRGADLFDALLEW